MPTRRKFLASAAATATGLAIVGTASAGHEDPYYQQPDYVDLYGLDTAQAELEQYRPALVRPERLDPAPTATYCWVATSTERATDVYCYWVYYQYQEGWTPWDSHPDDREPVYVYVDSDSGDVTAVGYDGYHYYYSETPVADADLYNGTHPTLRIQSPHHFYVQTPDVGALPDLADMHDIYEEWQTGGWGAAARPVVNPWTIRTRGNWWERDSVWRTVYDTSLSLARTTGVDPLGTGAADSDLTE